MIEPSILEKQVFSALRAVLLTIVDCAVIRTPVNRAAMPKGDFIALSPGDTIALSTNVSLYTDTTKTTTRPSQFTIQLDCYGTGASDRATAISILLRDEYAYEAFAAISSGIQTLYATDPTQMPLVTGEEQYMERWMFKSLLQFNPAVTTPQQSADELSVDLIEANRRYGP